MSNDELPLSIMAAKNAVMRFLRNEEYLTRVEIMVGGKYDTEDGLFVPPHWHPLHDEVFRVIKGRIEVKIGPTTRIYTPEDGEIVIPRRTVHSIRSSKGEHIIMEERTEPMDDEKELFFRNMLESGGLPTSVLQAAVVAYNCDVCPVFPWHILWLESAVST
ncbi:hypothetical protein NLJ89_g7279 [Agrocybe chaxingu]|uniref:Uncharacterized protein n=1 Tax=Agrocybe chaxingu TaxID=84603 RepID=A0A9W8JWN7_9AGAR|nr:hypothetical protein NLJ89_g7279 [Agrocybe chaxingu]